MQQPPAPPPKKKVSLLHLEHGQPRAHPGAPAMRRSDDSQLGSNRSIAVWAGPELGECELEGLVLLDAVLSSSLLWFFEVRRERSSRLRGEERRKKKEEKKRLVLVCSLCSISKVARGLWLNKATSLPSHAPFRAGRSMADAKSSLPKRVLRAEIGFSGQEEAHVRKIREAGRRIFCSLARSLVAALLFFQFLSLSLFALSHLQSSMSRAWDPSPGGAI